MRIREARPGDLVALEQLAASAAAHDGSELPTETQWQQRPEEGAAAGAVIFVLLDDDEELNPWGPAGTLEGVEGEIIGYTVLRLLRDPEGYHFRCEGTVHPQHRRRGGGRALLVCALNRARLWATEIEEQAEQEGLALFFEAWFPQRDPAARRLAAHSDMEAVDGARHGGQQLYRRPLLA
jgi:GNAT superfamily N-acetyltransferase